MALVTTITRHGIPLSPTYTCSAYSSSLVQSHVGHASSSSPVALTLILLALPSPLPAVLLLPPFGFSTFTSFVTSMPSIDSLSSSFSSIFTSSPAHTRIVGCQTMTILSSETLVAVQFSDSPGAQQKSAGRAVCPTKQNYSINER